MSIRIRGVMFEALEALRKIEASWTQTHERMVDDVVVLKPGELFLHTDGTRVCPKHGVVLYGRGCATCVREHERKPTGLFDTQSSVFDDPPAFGG